MTGGGRPYGVRHSDIVSVARLKMRQTENVTGNIKMRILRQSRVLEVEDGETIAIIAKTPGPTATDPCDNYPYVAKAFRVVADRIGPTLTLVPLSNEPVKLSQVETDTILERENELPPIPPCGGRATGNTTPTKRFDSSGRIKQRRQFADND